MFSGIIQQVQPGELVSGVLKIKRCWENLSVGESIAVNGVCLTLTKFDKEFMYFDVGLETLSKTNLGKCKLFNLEKALKMGDSISGHFVTGHVDGTIKFISKNSVANTTYMKFSIPSERWAISKKGSITLNGISLTVSDVDFDTFIIQIIPHTLEKTNLKHLTPGEHVNYEIDILARYIRNVIIQKEMTKQWEF